MKIFFAHYRHADYEKDLYEPLRASVLSTEHEIILPHEHGSVIKTKDVIRSADVVFAEVSYSATGVGIELGWADAFGKPIVCLYKKGTKPSGSLQFLTSEILEYENGDDLVGKVALAIARHL